jgi:hypothetical protein
VYWEVTSNTNPSAARLPSRSTGHLAHVLRRNISSQEIKFRTARKCRYINDSQSTRVPEILCPLYEQYSLIFGTAASARMTRAHPIAC